jgi:hypothetical protein
MTGTATDHHFRLHWGYHLGFWVAYTLFWHFIFSPDPLHLLGLVTSSIYTLAHAAGSYFNIFVLIPKLWRRSRWLYLLALLLTIAGASVLLAVLLGAWSGLLGYRFMELFFEDWNRGVASLLGSTFSGITLSLGLYLLWQRQQWDKQREKLEKGKLQAELQFLRGQLDPHFLFNALNNIYFLIKKDPERAATALAGFSELLRYQTYQAHTESVALADELRYLEEYVAVNRLRFSADADIQLTIPATTHELSIPPLLLLPPIENAFKHLDRENPVVHIHLELRNSELRMQVQNRPSPVPLKNNKDSSGIGLNNLRKRLQLLYPNRYHFHIKALPENYTVDLHLQLV